MVQIHLRSAHELLPASSFLPNVPRHRLSNLWVCVSSRLLRAWNVCQIHQTGLPKIRWDILSGSSSHETWRGHTG